MDLLNSLSEIFLHMCIKLFLEFFRCTQCWAVSFFTNCIANFTRLALLKVILHAPSM